MSNEHWTIAQKVCDFVASQNRPVSKKEIRVSLGKTVSSYYMRELVVRHKVLFLHESSTAKNFVYTCSKVDRDRYFALDKHPNSRASNGNPFLIDLVCAYVLEAGREVSREEILKYFNPRSVKASVNDLVHENKIFIAVKRAHGKGAFYTCDKEKAKAFLIRHTVEKKCQDAKQWPAMTQERKDHLARRRKEMRLHLKLLESDTPVVKVAKQWECDVHPKAANSVFDWGRVVGL